QKARNRRPSGATVLDRGLSTPTPPPAEIKSSVVGKRVSFTTTQSLSEGDLAGLRYSRLDINKDRVRLFTNAPEIMLRELFRRGIDVRDLEVVGADLEEAFLALTAEAEKETVA